MRITQLLVCAVLLAASVQTMAQKPGEVPAMVRRLADFCPQFVEQMASKPETASVYQARKVDVAAICKCSQPIVFADKKLTAHFDVDEKTQKERIRVKTTVAYATMRVMQSIFVCMAPEIDATLNLVVLEP